MCEAKLTRRIWRMQCENKSLSGFLRSFIISDLTKTKEEKKVLLASLVNIDVDRIKNDSCSKNFRQFDETRRDVIRFIFIIDEFLSLLSFLFSLISFYIYCFVSFLFKVRRKVLLEYNGFQIRLH